MEYGLPHRADVVGRIGRVDVVVYAHRLAAIGDVGIGPVVDARAAAARAFVGHDGAEGAIGGLIAKGVWQEGRAAVVGPVVAVAHVVAEFVGQGEGAACVGAGVAQGGDVVGPRREAGGEAVHHVGDATAAGLRLGDVEAHQIGQMGIAGGGHVVHKAVAGVLQAGQVGGDVAAFRVIGLHDVNQAVGEGQAALGVGGVHLADALVDEGLDSGCAPFLNARRRGVGDEQVYAGAIFAVGRFGLLRHEGRFDGVWYGGRLL